MLLYKVKFTSHKQHFIDQKAQQYKRLNKPVPAVQDQRWYTLGVMFYQEQQAMGHTLTHHTNR
jgi:hypothetical protein